ncbi:hypothetical protein [Streptomyces sp. NPDC048338]|uniref:hypothetical protein n=1 Tax=Streptomyces sp. NPDC048338 TaxID=3365536 RepID=UPI00371AB460
MNADGSPKAVGREAKASPTTTDARTPRFRVRLPGFVIEEDVGLGDAIKRATASAGITPCGSCRERAAALNRWMRFTSR